MTARNAYRTCEVCNAYLARRAEALAPKIAFRAFVRGVSGEVVSHEYMTLVHARHIAGGCLSTRRRTPDKITPSGGKRIHVKRVCNGCGADVGDVNDAELDAAVSGVPLPDVRLECGCWTQDGAA